MTDRQQDRGVADPGQFAPNRRVASAHPGRVDPDGDRDEIAITTAIAVGDVVTHVRVHDHDPRPIAA